MRIEILDHDVFSSVKPLPFTRYLRANGWEQIRQVDDELIVLRKQDQHVRENLVWVPMVEDATDYVTLVARAVQRVADADEKSELQVFDDIQTAGTGDVIRVGTVNPLDINDHTITLLQGEALLAKGRAMATAGAIGASASDKRPIYYGRSSSAAEFVQNLRLAQTERGSYLIKLIAPIIETGPGSTVQSMPELGSEIPFSRRAVVEMVRGLTALHDAAQDNQSRGRFHFKTFLDAVRFGVSANLCEALAPTDKTSEPQVPLEVSVTWSYAIESQDALPTNKLVFEPASFAYIREAAKQFRARNPETVTLTGWLKVTGRETRTGPGTVALLTHYEGRQRVVRVGLDAQTYQRAAQAHTDGQLVSVTGTLMRQGFSWRLDNASGFEILEQDRLIE